MGAVLAVFAGLTGRDLIANGFETHFGSLLVTDAVFAGFLTAFLGFLVIFAAFARIAGFRLGEGENQRIGLRLAVAHRHRHLGRSKKTWFDDGRDRAVLVVGGRLVQRAENQHAFGVQAGSGDVERDVFRAALDRRRLQGGQHRRGLLGRLRLVRQDADFREFTGFDDDVGRAFNQEALAFRGLRSAEPSKISFQGSCPRPHRGEARWHCAAESGRAKIRRRIITREQGRHHRVQRPGKSGDVDTAHIGCRVVGGVGVPVAGRRTAKPDAFGV